jgi:predicted permease
VLILNTLAPVFLMIGVGALLQRSAFVSPNFLKEANRLTYWVGLPALLFVELARSFHDAGGARLMFGAMLTATLVVIALAYGVARLLRVPAAATGTFLQGAFRGNLAFVGLPILYALPDTPVAGRLSVRATAIVILAPMMVLYNLAGVSVLLLSQHTLGWGMVKPFLKQLVTTPPLVATVAGCGVALAGWTLPTAVEKTLGPLGEMALPLGLLGVGGSIATLQLGDAWRSPLAAALVKTMVSPALGWIVGRWLGLGATELRLIMIFMATPTAIISYPMALELKGDGPLASGAIVLSVIASMLSLVMVLGFF